MYLYIQVQASFIGIFVTVDLHEISLRITDSNRLLSFHTLSLDFFYKGLPQIGLHQGFKMVPHKTFLLVAAVAILVKATWGAYYGRRVGAFVNGAHEVSGTVYVVDETRLFIKDFTFDGNAPDAFFYFGTTGAVPTQAGTIIPDEKGTKTKLLTYNKEDLLLTLTQPSKVTDIKWLSIWCREAGADFSSFTFPPTLVPPAATALATIPAGAHETSAGTITVLNSRTIRIESFSYDGSAPDTFFILIKGTSVHWAATTSVKVPDETGSLLRLRKRYDLRTIDIVTPEDVNIADYDWFSVYCIGAKESFGHVAIPSGLSVPPADSELTPDSTYYGLEIGLIKTLQHSVSGKVYVVNYNTLFIKDFNFDGAAPDSFFYFGISGNPSGTPSGQIPDEQGLLTKLLKYNGESIILTMPNTHNVTDIHWLSVWCRQANADLGNIYFPDIAKPPRPASIPSITTVSHGVSGGPVTLLDSRTIRIENFKYDGGAPDTFFLLGKGNTVKYIFLSSVKVPDENGKIENLQPYAQKTIQIQAPPGVNIADYDWLSVYCLQAGESFGHFNIPDELSLPPSEQDLRNADQERLANCMQLSDGELNVHWEVMGDDIMIELEGIVDGNDAYMSFGLSGDSNTNKMVGADVVVAYYDSITPKAVDYSLTQRSQCSQGQGACPDAKNDVTVITGSRADGVTKIRFKRRLNTSDSDGDTVIPTSTEIAVVWALGKLTPQKLALKHRKRTPSLLKVNFGRTAARTCTPLRTGSGGEKPPAWKELKISGQMTNTFNFTIGQSGGMRGYSGITGVQGWGIAYYINDLLIPELTLEVGEEYTFNIETGNDTGNTAEYHPVYITSDSTGGYVGMDAAARSKIKVYAGLDDQGKPLDAAVGRLCEYFHTSIDQSASKEAFADFFPTLRLKCHEGKTGTFKWTPTTVGTYYYQCYQHRYLGWKIKVVDTFASAAPIPDKAGVLFSLCLCIVALFRI